MDLNTAKNYLSNHYLIVNGEKENRRGRKLRESDVIEVNNEKYLIENES